MDARVLKLDHLLKDKELAARLVRAGLSTPRLIKAATNRELLAVEGVGPVTMRLLREKFPQA